MQDGIDRSGNFDIARDVLPPEPKARMRKQVRNIRIGAGDQIIQAENFPPALYQKVAKMRSEESRSARNDRAQIAAPSKTGLYLSARVLLP